MIYIFPSCSLFKFGNAFSWNANVMDRKIKLAHHIKRNNIIVILFNQK